jgi:phospholipase C
MGPYPNVGALAGQSTVPLDNELFNGKAGTPAGSGGVVGPCGRGVRVPLLAVSPWSTGGWVCSEPFDHTSLSRFIEARLRVDEPNITPWRRAVCGDLTSAFDFESASDVPPLPSVASTSRRHEQPHPHPDPPAVGSVPTQGAGVRPSRRPGYRVHVGFDADPRKLNLAVKNGTSRPAPWLAPCGLGGVCLFCPIDGDYGLHEQVVGYAQRVALAIL